MGRIEELERHLRLLQEHKPANDHTNPKSGIDAFAEIEEPRRSDASKSQDHHVVGDEGILGGSSPILKGREDVVDGMGATLLQESNEEIGYFGK